MLPPRSSVSTSPTPAVVRNSDARAEDRGSAPIEFLVTGVLLLVPVVYLVLTLGSLQAAAFAAEGAARHGARVAASSAHGPGSRFELDGIVDAAVTDFGIRVQNTHVAVECQGPCGQSGALVAVAVRIDVRLPLVPDAIGAILPTSVPVTAEAVQRVSLFRPSEAG